VVEAVKAACGDYVTGGTGTGQEDSIVFAYLDGAFDLDTPTSPSTAAAPSRRRWPASRSWRR
jgi:hypothetical protein